MPDYSKQDDFLDGCFIKGMDLKRNADLSEQALSGAKIIDNEDFYEEAKKFFPENDSQLKERVGNTVVYYMDQHTKSQGKNIAKLVFCHAGVMRPLALYFGAESMELSEASYVASFEAVRQGNKNVELLKNVNNDYVKH